MMGHVEGIEGRISQVHHPHLETVARSLQWLFAFLVSGAIITLLFLLSHFCLMAF